MILFQHVDPEPSNNMGMSMEEVCTVCKMFGHIYLEARWGGLDSACMCLAMGEEHSCV